MLNLAIKIKGKTTCGDWTAKDAVRELLCDRYDRLQSLSGLDIGSELGFQWTQTEESQLVKNDRTHSREGGDQFVSLLQKVTNVFQNNVNTNEAKARNFINPFLVRGIKKVQSQYPKMGLSVEMEFSGDRGYGKLDYVVSYLSFAVLVTEAKMNAVEAGIAQNLAQLCTVFRAKSKRKPQSMIYGIVTTGATWVFVRRKSPGDVKYSKPFHCSLSGKMETEKTVPEIIVGILLAQAKEFS